MHTLAIVVPCYNEQEMLPITIEKLSNLVFGLINNNKISKESYLYLIDDGSKDKTWELVENYSKKNKIVRGVKLTRNFGHQSALIAGLFVTKEDVVISIDADLQDDINVIEEMIDAYNNDGCEIVYGVRRERTTDTFFKKLTAELFYKLMKKLGVDIVYNHADFRLMSRKALLFFEEFTERNLFVRAIVPLIGLKNTSIYYERKEREHGISKYPLKKMIAFAIEGITSFSNIPLRFITWLGISISLSSFIVILWILISTQIFGKVVSGWSSTIISIYFIGGAQILSIGVIGEYLGKIYKEVKQRPRFLIEKTI